MRLLVAAQEMAGQPDFATYLAAVVPAPSTCDGAPAAGVSAVQPAAGTAMASMPAGEPPGIAAAAAAPGAPTALSAAATPTAAALAAAPPADAALEAEAAPFAFNPALVAAATRAFGGDRAAALRDLIDREREAREAEANGLLDEHGRVRVSLTAWRPVRYSPADYESLAEMVRRLSGAGSGGF